MGPLIEGTVSSDEVFDTGYEASLRLFMIARQEKRELIKRIQVLFDAMARALGPRVLLLLGLCDFRPPKSSLCLLKFLTSAVCDLSQDLLREHAATAEFDLLVHQVTQDVFTFLTNCRYVLQVDNKFAVAEVCSRLFARSPQLDCPGGDELAF